jgi:thiamine-phosphate pyrophosphorylase
MYKLSHCRFYAILDTSYVSRNELYKKCSELIEGGADILQLRAKKQTHAEKIQIVDEILPLFKNSKIPFIINDDIELCLRYEGLGLHVGQDDIAVEIAREKLGPDRILGLSTHSIEQAKEAISKKDLLDYFAVGPVFATQTKPDYIPVGLELVKQVSALNPPLPFFTIGGINRKTISSVCNSGATRVVAVSDVLCDNSTVKAVKEIKSHL